MNQGKGAAEVRYRDQEFISAPDSLFPPLCFCSCFSSSDCLARMAIDLIVQMSSIIISVFRLTL